MLSVIIPVFNEEGNIKNLVNNLEKIIKKDDEIIVVDDASTDNTFEVAKGLNCKVIKHEKNSGKGSAIINGIKIAKGDNILFMDGDGQDDPSELCKLTDKIEKGYDLVIGSRFVEDETKKITRYTKTALSNINWFGNKALTFLLNFLFKLDVKDTQSGYKCFKSASLKKLNLVSKRYEIESEMIIKSKKHNFKICEVPVHRYTREYGKSHLFDIPFGRLIFTIKVLRVIIVGYIKWR